ncbi:MAG: tetratricopeptide repeat protein [Caldilineales bacterium]|nr:tetratricopeptide repeat protein [Caldilineales bacterium]
MTDLPPASSADAQARVHALLNEGARLLRSQRPEEALAPLREAHKLAPHDPDIAINLGGALVMAAKWSRAVRFLEEAVARHPHNAHLWLNLAAAYLGRLPLASRQAQNRAIAAYEQALSIDPQAANAQYNLGLIYAERQEWEQARARFQAALATDPQDRDAALWLQRVAQILEEER